MYKKQHLAVALLALLATQGMGCSDEMDTGIAPEKAELKISAEMAGYSNDETKAMVTGSTFSNGESIGVYVLNGSGAAYDGQACSNLQYNLGTGAGRVQLSPISRRLPARSMRIIPITHLGISRLSP